MARGVGKGFNLSMKKSGAGEFYWHSLTKNEPLEPKDGLTECRTPGSSKIQPQARTKV